jgi:hypothetical protein
MRKMRDKMGAVRRSPHLRHELVQRLEHGELYTRSIGVAHDAAQLIERHPQPVWV